MTGRSYAADGLRRGGLILGFKEQFAPLDRPSKVLIAFTVFACCFYVITYFFAFYEGQTAAPLYLRGTKEIFWGVVLAASFQYLFATRFKLSEHVASLAFLLWLQFFLISLVILPIHAFHLNPAKLVTVYVKNYLIYGLCVPVMLLASGQIRLLARGFSNVVVTLGLLQIAVGFALTVFFPSQAFWRDDPWEGFAPLVGFFANPNRFGLFLNIGLCFLLAKAFAAQSSRRFVMMCLAIALFAVGVAYTAALSQLMVLLGALAYGGTLAVLLLGGSMKRFLVIVAAVALSVFVFARPLVVKHPVVRGIRSLSTCGSREGARVSDSICNRVAEVAAAWRYARSAGLPVLMLGSFGNEEPLTPDSQFNSAFRNWGIVGVASFLLLLVGLGVRSLLMMKGKAVDRATRFLFFQFHVALLCFAATFLVDNVLYNFPTNFLFFFIVGVLTFLSKSADASPESA